MQKEKVSTLSTSWQHWTTLAAHLNTFDCQQSDHKQSCSRGNWICVSIEWWWHTVFFVEKWQNRFESIWWFCFFFLQMKPKYMIQKCVFLSFRFFWWVALLLLPYRCHHLHRLIYLFDDGEEFHRWFRIKITTEKSKKKIENRNWPFDYYWTNILPLCVRVQSSMAFAINKSRKQIHCRQTITDVKMRMMRERHRWIARK